MDSCCPCCGRQTRRVHSHYMRQLTDLPWQGRVVEIRLHARRFRCANSQCPRRIFTERLPETVRPKARRTVRLGESQMAIGFAVGGEPGSRLSDRLAMPVSGDTLLRMIRAAGFEPPQAPRVVGIDDWAWRKGQRYGTIICDLERNRVLDLLPDRNADTVASWLERHPGIEIIARDRAGVYAEGAHRGAPDATQVADRWYLLQNLGEALRLAVGRHRKAVKAAGKAMTSEMAANDDAEPDPSAGTSTKLDGLRQSRRNQRSELYAEILQLHSSGMSPRQIAPQIGICVRTVERWLAAGGEPELRRPQTRSVLMDPFQEYLEKRWQEGQHNGFKLWTEIKSRGFAGSRATVYRWTAARDKKRPSSAPPNVRWRPPSRRYCAWLLSQDPSLLDEPTVRFLRHLHNNAPELSTAGELASRFATLIRGDDDAGLEQWIEDASSSELASLAAGIDRDIAAVRAAITQPWSMSPVEGQINRLKTIKRQMYGRSGYPLLRNRLLAAA
ncbi:MAG: ISL3 family transposase [Mesorhizobium sp.]|nr:MAG: ISL3 family transposase [Mesorhizobium sp.]TIO54443.1 MAG: ISL3 family transposase [Mesorhizobium sp.]TIO59474.1 MAG: ISL3 family transposase [Mesorhizobium sp.]TJV63944.1 MAG: ISL3 family transposase [Mesorhizobium sp.]